MATVSPEDELIDVVVRLPRKAVEATLLSIPTVEKDASQRRLAEVKALLTGRRRRAACFSHVRFHDPSWDMILELYVATREDRSVTVSQLCNLSGGSTTTALRHIENMEALGYMARGADPTDRRRLIITMLPELSNTLEDWLDLRRAASLIGA